MSTTTAKSGEIEETELDELRTRVVALGSEIQKLEGSLATSRLRRENLIAERGPLILPARSQKNADAQKRLRTIDEGLAHLTRDVADDQAAISELKEQLRSAEERVVREEWEIRRAAVRKLLADRGRGATEAKLEKLASELAAALRAAAEEDECICAKVIAFERSLYGGISELRRRARERNNIIAAKFFGLLPIDTREVRPIVYSGKILGSEVGPVIQTLAALDDLELVF